jgi:hypothetical protein
MLSCFQAKAEVLGNQTIYIGYNAGQLLFYQPYFEERREYYLDEYDQRLDLGPWMQGVFVGYRLHLSPYWSMDVQYLKRAILSNRIEVEDGYIEQYRYTTHTFGYGHAFLNQPRLGMMADLAVVRVEKIHHPGDDIMNARWQPNFFMADGKPQRVQFAAGATFFASFYAGFLEIRPYIQFLTRVFFYQGFDIHYLNASGYGLSLSIAIGK